MPPGLKLNDVPLPDEWDEWPEEAKINYIASTMDREQMLSMAADLADIPDDQVGAQSFLKAGLAQLIVTLEECDSA